MPSETLSDNNKTWTPSPKELRSLHGVLTRARFEAYQNGLSGNDLGKVLDEAEYLVTLLMSNEADAEELFHGTLQHLENRFPAFEGIAARYANDAEGGTIAVASVLTPKSRK